MTSWGCLRAGVGTLARRPQGGGPARSVDLYPNAILFTAVPPYEGTNGAAVHSGPPPSTGAAATSNTATQKGRNETSQPTRTLNISSTVSKTPPKFGTPFEGA